MQTKTRNKNHHFDQLCQTMRKLSVATSWDDIRDEWTLDHVYEQWGGECVCGYWPLRERCVIRNVITGELVEVGNHCVRHFLGRDCSLLFQGISRIKSDIANATNQTVLDYAYDRDWLNAWEYEFYRDTWRKRKPSSKQQLKRIQVNERILRNYERTTDHV